MYIKATAKWLYPSRAILGKMQPFGRYFGWFLGSDGGWEAPDMQLRVPWKRWGRLMEIGWKGCEAWAAAAWFIGFRILRDHPLCTMQWWQNRHLSEINKLASVGPNMSLVDVLRDSAPSLRVLTAICAQSYLYPPAIKSVNMEDDAKF